MKKSEVIHNQIEDKKEALSNLNNAFFNPFSVDKQKEEKQLITREIENLEIAKSEAVQEEGKEAYQREIDAKNIALNTPNWKLEILRGFFMPLAVSIIGTVVTTMILFKFGLLGK